MTIPHNLIAIDPGAVHCGVALFADDRCVGTFDRSPPQLFHGLETTDAKVWVVEEFRLYPWVKQDFDLMRTPEVIGVIKYIATKRKIELHMQPAMIKKPTRGHLRSRGVELLEGNTHEKDAQLHGWHFLLKGGKSG